ncbi:hypothetical protein BGZ82_009616 [Podila clonocystis]|nr:hypothetical protein BGZ82_009616 [Podila clonocystis]
MTAYQRILFIRPEAKRALKRNARYVHNISIHLDNKVVYKGIFTRHKVRGSDANTNISTRLQKLSIVSYQPVLEALSNLTISNLYGNEVDDSTIAVTISLSSGHLKHLYLSDCPQAGPLTVAAILDYSQELEYLDLSRSVDRYTGGIRSKDLHTILCKAPKLKTLIALGNAAAKVVLDADDVLGSEWSAKSLEVFRCPIMVPRADQRQSLDGRHEDDKPAREVLERGCKVQRQVYARLATQVKTERVEACPLFCECDRDLFTGSSVGLGDDPREWTGTAGRLEGNEGAG